MIVYVASSWKNQHAVELLTVALRNLGHEVRSFIENAGREEHDVRSKRLDFGEWCWSDEGEEKFRYDTGAAAGADLVVYVGPSGTDAWAEVGAAWQAGVLVLGLWAKGEGAGLMRRMVHWVPDVQMLLGVIGVAVQARTAEHVAETATRLREETER